MRLLVSGATATLRRYVSSPYPGALLVPGARTSIETVLRSELPWAADNAAFTGLDPAAFCRMLGRIAGNAGCRFVACPDVVGMPPRLYGYSLSGRRLEKLVATQ